MNGETIIKFAFNLLLSFVYYFPFLFVISLKAENYVKIWLCAVVEIGDYSIF